MFSARRFLGWLFATFCALAPATAALAQANLNELKLTQTPWIKVCTADKTCVTNKDGRTGDGTVGVAVSVIDRPDGQTKIRILWTLSVQLVHGTRLVVDDGARVISSYTTCSADGCIAETADRDAIDQLQKAGRLFVQAFDVNGKPVTANLPMAGFNKARRGAATPAASLDAKQSAYLATILNEPKPGDAAPFGPGQRWAYSPWSRFCLANNEKGRVCFTGADARTSRGTPMLATVIIEPDAANSSKLLRITLPLEVDLKEGMQYRVDDEPLRRFPYVICMKNGCMADLTLTPDLLASMRTGANINLKGKHANGQVIDLEMPLAGLAAAHSGPPLETSKVEEQQKELNAKLKAGDLSPPQPVRAAALPAPPLKIEPGTASLLTTAPSRPALAPAQTAAAPPPTAPSAPVPAATPASDRRVALVMGNAAYSSFTRLPNPTNDATDFAAELRALNFEVILGVDLTRSAMENSIAEFAKRARSADTALVFYAGHGLQYNGINYLVPIDVALSDETDLRRMINMQDVLNDLQNASRVRILMVDACRDNEAIQQLANRLPKSRSASLSRGLAKVEADGTIVAFATQPNRVAIDGDDRNSPFTRALIKRVKEPGVDVRVMLTRVRSDVVASTGGSQRPEVWDSLIGEFSFR